MAVQLALPNALAGRMKLPDAVPPFSNRIYRLFLLLWVAALLLAIAGPIVGLYDRYAHRDNDALLLPGSRAGIAVSEQDATEIRFTIGPYTRELGIRPGDDIIAIFDLPVPEELPLAERDLTRDVEDPARQMFDYLLAGTDQVPIPVTLRSPDGAVRTVTIETGDQHIEAGARELGVPATLLGFVDLVHVITYPFLLWAAWILHRRNARDVVSSILSLAILLTMGTEMPSAAALALAGVPRPVHAFLYDLANICLLTGILLFPYGRLSLRIVALIAALPLLFFLHGDFYRMVFMGFMICAVLMLVRCLQRTPPGDLRQQIKWALYGFSTYATFLAISLVSDMLKSAVGSFAIRLLIEMLSGFALGIAFLSLQLGLLVALLRYRLYDAESVISRTASFAIITLVLGAAFAGVMEGIITTMQILYGETSETGAAMAGAVAATVLINPLHERVQNWVEGRFHRNLIELRDGLPALMRDLREVASAPEFLQEVLSRVNNGVHAVRSAVVVGRGVEEVLGISQADALRWLISFKPGEGDEPFECDLDDKLFPLRIRLGSGPLALGWLLVGPRPDGSVAGGDDREALVDVADQLTRSLRIVLKRDKESREISSLLDAFRSRIERLERALSI